MKVSRFDRATCSAVKEAMLAALKPVEEQYGVQFSTAAGKFDSTSFEFKITAGITGEDGVNLGEKSDFELYCFSFGLRPEDYGTVFSYGGKTYKLKGLRPRRRSFPLLCEVVAGGRGRRGPGGEILLPREAASLIRLATDKAKKGK